MVNVDCVSKWDKSLIMENVTNKDDVKSWF